MILLRMKRLPRSKRARCWGIFVIAEKNRRSFTTVIVELKKNYQFSRELGIYRLSQSVNAGRRQRAFTFLPSAARICTGKSFPETAGFRPAAKPIVIKN